MIKKENRGENIIKPTGYKFLPVVLVLLALIILSATLIFSVPFDKFATTVVPESEMSASANWNDQTDATSEITSFPLSESTSAVAITPGDVPASALNLSFATDDGDGNDKHIYKKYNAKDAFGVDPPTDNRDGTYAFSCTLQMKLPNWFVDLIVNNQSDLTISGSYNFKKSTFKTYTDVGTGYIGYKVGSSRVKSNSVSIDESANNAGTLLPSHETTKYDLDFDKNTGGIDGTFSFSIGYSSISRDNCYISLGVAGWADDHALLGGFADINGRLSKIKLSVKCNTTLSIIVSGKGSVDYSYYKDATATSLGDPETGTVSEDSTHLIQNTNPFAFVVVTPKESVYGYRFDNISIGDKTNQRYDYDITKNIAPNTFLIAPFESAALDRSSVARDYTELKGNSTKDTTVTFVARTYKVIYSPNGGKGDPQPFTYTYDETYTFPNPVASPCNFSKSDGSIAGPWLYDHDNKGTTGGNVGNQFAAGNSFKNLYEKLDTNDFEITMNVQWVEAGGSAGGNNGATKFAVTAETKYTELYSDVTYEIVWTYTGHTLANVYAEYSSGDLSGKRIALEKRGGDTINGNETTSHWCLYAMSGNCKLYPEWQANVYSIDYDCDSTKGTIGTITYDHFVFGVGISYMDLPLVTASSGNVFKGWSLQKDGSSITSSTVLNNTSSDVTLYATFNQATIPQTYGDTKDSSLTSVSGWSTTSNYVTSGQTMRYSSSSTTLTGTYFSWGYHKPTTTAPSGLYWIYWDGSTSNPPSLTRTAEPSSDNQSFTGYAHYYIALTGEALKAFRSGKTVTISAEIGYSVAVFKSGSDPNASAQISLGMTQSFETGSTISNPENGTSVTTTKDNQWYTASGTIPNSISLTNSGTSVPGVTLQLYSNCTCSKGGSSEYTSYSGITSVKYSISWGSQVERTIVFDGNGGTLSNSSSTVTTLKSYKAANNTSWSFTFPSNFYTRTGYEFVGWNTTSGATSGTLPGANGTSSVEPRTYYAIWKVKYFPVTTYDVFINTTPKASSSASATVDGAGTPYEYATEIRTQWYVPYGGSVAYNGTGASYTLSGTSSTLSAKAGGNDYAGFTIYSSYGRYFDLSGDVTNTTTKSNSWEWGGYLTGYSLSSYKQTGVKKATWGYFVWILNAPSAAPENAEVDYGTSINLENYTNPSHGATNPEFTYKWFFGSSGSEYVFYRDDQPILYAVEESGNYTFWLTVTVYRDGKPIQKALVADANKIAATINAIRLKLVDNEKHEFAYTGQIQEFPLTAEVDEEYYKDKPEQALTRLKSIFQRESDINGTFRPWYYNSGGKNDDVKWKYGLRIAIIGMGYASYVGSSDGYKYSDDIYSGTMSGNMKAFRDAGIYWASSVALYQLDPETQNSTIEANKNYVWTKSNGHIFNAADISEGAAGTVVAEIKPASLELYAIYIKLGFGTLYDPIKHAEELGAPTYATEVLDGIRSQYATDNNSNVWILGTNGLLGTDLDNSELLTSLASALAREVGSKPYSSGRYNVYLNLSQIPLAIKNNYGVRVTSDDSTSATDSNITLFWVDEEGNVMSGDGFDFVGDVSAYAGQRDNFEIESFSVNIEARNAEYNYDGQLHGQQVAIPQIPPEKEREAFKTMYGLSEFRLYVYGIEMPTDYSSMTEAQRNDYITAHYDEAVKVGYNGVVGADTVNNYITDSANNFVRLVERHAGSYGCIIVGIGFDDGVDHINEGFVLGAPITVSWVIKPAVVSVDAKPTGSMLFGEQNYGGMNFTFTGIVAGEYANLKLSRSYLNATTGASHTDKTPIPAYNYFRYSTLSDENSAVVESGEGKVYSVYGSFPGTYTIDIGDIQSSEADGSPKTYETYGNHGAPYGNDYSISSGEYTIRITARELQITREYTSDGETFSSAAPEMVYKYGVLQGVRVTVGNFVTPDCYSSDIAVPTKVEEHDKNIRIEISKIFDPDNNLKIYWEVTEGSFPNGIVPDKDYVGLDVRYELYAYNAGNYTTNISKLEYKYNGEELEVITLPSNVTNQFTIKKKAIALNWLFDDKSDSYTTIYDGKEHVLAAQFVSADGIDVNDKKVYSGDFIDETHIYTLYQNAGQYELRYTGTSSSMTAGTYKLQVSGFAERNYSLENGSNSFTITRRAFSLSIASPGTKYTYNGRSQSVTVTINTAGDDGFNVTLSGDDITDLNDNIKKHGAVNFNIASTGATLSATNVGRYAISYSAGSGIEIGSNYLLTGELDYREDDPILIIIPLVLQVEWQSVSATYSSENLASSFNATLATSLPSNLIPTINYSLTEIIHAGTYVQKIVSVSGNANVVMASAELASQWYYPLDPKYGSAEIIATYSHNVTVNKRQIDVPASDISAYLTSVVYDGAEHSYPLADIYEKFIKTKLYEVDREKYSLSGTSPVGKNVGTYNVTFNDFVSSDEYLDYRIGAFNESWAITRRALSFAFADYHSGGSEYSYDGNNHGVTMTISNLVGTETLTFTFTFVGAVRGTASGTALGNGDYNFFATNAGTYSVTVDGISNGTGLPMNYSLPDVTKRTSSWTIAKREITVVWRNTELVYRAAQYTPNNGGVYAEISNYVGSDNENLTFVYTGATGTDANTYHAQLTEIGGTAASNYQISGDLACDWKINPKVLKDCTFVTSWNNGTFTVVYDGATKTVRAEPVGGATSDDDGKVYDGDLTGSAFRFVYSSESGYVTSASLAGTYKTKVINAESSNYITEPMEQEWTISPRALTVSYTNNGKVYTYSGNSQGITLVIGNVVATDWSTTMISVASNATLGSWSGSGGTYNLTINAINKGDYSATATISEAFGKKNCYTLPENSGTFNIDPLVATLAWLLDGGSTFTVTYDGKDHKVTARVSNAVGSSPVSVELTDNVQRNAGAYVAKAVGLNNDNYTLDPDEAKNRRTYVITARAVTVQWRNAEYTYNGKYQSDVLTVQNLIAEDSVYVKVKFMTGSYSGSQIKYDLYNATGAATYIFTAAQFAATINAGRYYAVMDPAIYDVDGEIDNNYSFTPADDSDRTQYTILQADVVLTGEWYYNNDKKGDNLPLDGAVLTYNQSAYTVTTEIDPASLFVRDDTGVKDELTLNYSANSNVHVGSSGYVARVSSLGGTYAANYKVPTDNSSISYNIAPKKVTIVWADHSDLIYKGSSYTVTASVAFGATGDDDGKAYDGDAVTVRVTGGSGTNATNYTATATSLSNADYTIDSAEPTKTLAWEIKPLPVELSWSADSFVYNGNLRTVTATITNIISGQSVTLTYNNNTATDVGTYVAEVTALSSANYTLVGGTNVTHEWAITPVLLGFSSTGSGFVYNGGLQGITVTVQNIVSADRGDKERLSFDITSTAEEVNQNSTTERYTITIRATAAGSYSAAINGILGISKSNYSLPNPNPTYNFTIAKLAVEISWNAPDRVYCAENIEALATVSNLVSGDVIVLTFRTVNNTGTYSVSGGATIGNVALHADNYTTTVTAVDNTNYTVTNGSRLSKTWTINQKTVTQFTYLLDGKADLAVMYDGTTHRLTAAPVSGAVEDEDGKIYSSDAVTVAAYRTEIVTNYGISAINSNGAMHAGEYKVYVSRLSNGGYEDYAAQDDGAGFTIEKRTLSVTKADYTASGFVYNGQEQGLTITVSNIVGADNTQAALTFNAAAGFTGTRQTPTRTGNVFKANFVAKGAGTYEFTLVASGTEAPDYEFASESYSFTIMRRDITTEISAEVTSNIVYDAEQISASDLEITFSNLVGNERLDLGTQFSVEWLTAEGAAMEGAPTDAGNYQVRIKLTESVTNYTLTGTTTFDFEIKKYEITSNMLRWYLGGDSVNINSLSFKADEHKTLTAEVYSSGAPDVVFGKIVGKTLIYHYFGFCSCGADGHNNVFHEDHQWLLDEDGNFRTEGPVHAGTYWLTVEISGADSANFAFTGFAGYSGTTYFVREGGETYLVYSDDKTRAIDKPLPKNDENRAVVSFNIARSQEGFTAPATPHELPFSGYYYTAKEGGGLPYITDVAGKNPDTIQVDFNGEVMTYAEYVAAEHLARNVGEYDIRIYDTRGGDGEEIVTDCDLFITDAVLEVNVILTITKAQITVTDLSSLAGREPFHRVYNRQTSYAAANYSYNKDVEFKYEKNDDGVVTSKSDGVLKNTTVTITAAYSDFNAGGRTLTFTLGGADALNYYLVFNSSAGVPVSDDDVTETDLTNSIRYAISDSIAGIDKKLITVVGDTDKVFDGTTEVIFEVTSSDILSGDSVTVTGNYENANVGTWKITLTTDNPNYAISTDIEARGEITPKPLTVNWYKYLSLEETGEDVTANHNGITFNYNATAQGLTVKISGMVEGFFEEMTATFDRNKATATTVTLNRYAMAGGYGFTNEAADEYDILLRLKDNSNYMLNEGDNHADFAILAVYVTITGWQTDSLADGKYIYDWDGYTVKFSNVARSVTPVIGGVFGKDDVRFTTTRTSGTNVNTYAATVTGLTGAASGNYLMPTSGLTKDWQIIRADIEGLSMEDESHVYDGQYHGLNLGNPVTQHGVPIDEIVYSGGEILVGFSSASTGANAIKDVGSATITASIAKTQNYNAFETSAKITITEAKLESITLDSAEFTYDKTAHALTVSSTTTRYGDTIEVTYTISSDKTVFTEGNSAINAGTYTVKAQLSHRNYEDKELTATLTINRADISQDRIDENIEGGRIVYDAQYHGIAITVTDDETQYGDPVTIKYYGGENNSGQAKNVGEYSINAVVSAGSNYNDYRTREITLTIVKKQVNIIFPEDDFTYTAVVLRLDIAFETGAAAADDGKVYDDDKASINLTYSVLGTSGAAQGQTIFRNAGSYTITVELGNDNYEPANTEVLNIKKADITGWYYPENTVAYNGNTRYLALNDSADVYTSGMRATVSLLGTDRGSVTYFYNTTSADGEYSLTFAGARNAGTYYLKAIIDGGDNYNPLELKSMLKIEAAEVISFTLSDLSVTFDGSEHNLVISAAAGRYNDGVYTTVYGDVMTPIYTISDRKGNDLSGNGATDVNVDSLGEVISYLVTVALDFGENNVNYTRSSRTLTGNLTINPADLGGIELVGGEFVYNGEPHAIQLTIPSSEREYPKYIISDDKTYMTVILSAGHNGGKGDRFDLTGSVSGLSGGNETPINVGDYIYSISIKPGEGTKASNYNAVAGMTATIKITPANASDSSGNAYVEGENIFFVDREAVYNGKAKYLILSDTEVGSILTEDLKSVLSSFNIHPESNPLHTDVAEVLYLRNDSVFEGAIDAGTYEIRAIIRNSNYFDVTLTAVVTIRKATIDYYFVGATLTYDMTTHHIAVNSREEYLDNSDVSRIPLADGTYATITYSYTSIRNGSGAFGGAYNADTYTVTATINVPDDRKNNFETWGENNSMTADLIVAPFAATLEWTGLTPDGGHPYNGSNHSPEVSASFIGADGKTTGNMTLTFLGISGKGTGETQAINAGTYTVTATYLTEDNPWHFNYSFGADDTVKEMIVMKADITLFLAARTMTYDGQVYYLNASNVRDGSKLSTVKPSDEYSPGGNMDAVKLVYTYSEDKIIVDGRVVTVTEGARNFGVHTVRVKLDLGEGESNYNEMEELGATITISVKALTLNAENLKKVYDGTRDMTDYTIDGIAAEDDNYLEFKAQFTNAAAGKNKEVDITIEPTSEEFAFLKDNYSFSTRSNGEIEKRELKFGKELTDWQKQYDGTADLVKTLDATTDNDLIADDSVTISGSYNSKNVREANKITFALSGADSGNYFIADLDFSDVVDVEKGIYLITPRTSKVEWSTLRSTVYNGTARTVTATIALFGDDKDAYGATLNLEVTFTYLADSFKTEKNIENAELKNAGTYLARAHVPEEIDENLAYNYGINASDESTNSYTISPVDRNVVWTGLTETYTYNGQDQGGKITATVALLGDDATAYTGDYFLLAYANSSSGVQQIFKNAGSYSLSAAFAPGTEYDDLRNNYRLLDASKTCQMARAPISNLSFSGNFSVVYYKGYTYSFFVTSDKAKGYEVISTETTAPTTTFYYEFDSDLRISISYSGGESSHALTTGLNEAKNVKHYEITATVNETTNYLGWSETVSVDITKGTINNVYFERNNGVVYDGQWHYVYARNEGRTPQSTVELPDRTTVTPSYKIGCTENPYDNYTVRLEENSNRAIDAGTYVINATITDSKGNYDVLVLSGLEENKQNHGALLSITQSELKVEWLYGNNDSTADFTYNAEDQIGKIHPRVVLPGSGLEATNYPLGVSVLLKETDANKSLDEEIGKHFAVAGTYTATAYADPELFENENEYNRFMNNIGMTGTELQNLVMKQYTVTITWYFTGAEHKDGEVFDENRPCTYNAQEHSVTAEALGLNGATMGVVRAGVFAATNANENGYVARVSGLEDGTDSITLDGKSYEVNYSINYRIPSNYALTWRIMKREINIRYEEGANAPAVSKIYDGTASFRLSAPKFAFSLTDETARVGEIMTEYSTLNAKESEYTSMIRYYLTNIMEADKDKIRLAISSVTASVPTVNAGTFTVAFSQLSFGGNGSPENYKATFDLTGRTFTGVKEHDEDPYHIITPIKIKINYSSDLGHVYNGKTFERTFDYDSEVPAGLFSATSLTGGPITLISGNKFVGRVYAADDEDNPAVNAGEYKLTGSISVKDANENENYVVVTERNITGTYIIEKRQLKVDFTNLLQSLQAAFADVGYSLDYENSVLDDLENAEELRTLIETDGYVITVVNDWKNESYDSYVALVGNESATFGVVGSSENYTFDDPVLQLTFAKVEDAEGYVFSVENADDLLHLDADSYGLFNTRTERNVGKLPTFIQKADIDGIVDGQYTILRTIRVLEGIYDGGNHYIKSFIVLPAVYGAESRDDSLNVGLFGKLAGGEIKDLSLYDISVYAMEEMNNAGILLGLAEEGGRIDNVVVEGYLRAAVRTEGNVGGAIGKAERAEITSLDFVGNIYVESSGTNLSLGGAIGSFTGSAQKINSFADIRLFLTAEPSTYYVGGAVGYSEAEITDLKYLASGIYINDGTGRLSDAAIGNTQETTGSSDFDAFTAVNEIYDLLRKYIIRELVAATGTTSDPVKITNWRQVSLLTAYPFMAFEISSDIYSPLNLATAQRGFYGVITEAKGKIYAAVPSDVSLFDAAKGTTEGAVIMILRDEKRF